MDYLQKIRLKLSAEDYPQFLRLGSGDKELVMQDRVLTWANGITLARLLILPMSVWLIAVQHSWLAALGLLWLAALMDGVDGYIARRLNQITRIGMWLDPAVDRLAMVTIALTLALEHVISVWLLAALILRDCCVAVLALIAWRKGNTPKITGAGKIGTIALFLGLPGFLISKSPFPGASFLLGIMLGLTIAGVGLYYWSLLQ